MGNTKFSLVKEAKDKRHASWEHVIRNLASHVTASCTNDCYLSTFKDDKGASRYAMHKFAKSTVNVGVHRTAAVLAFPDRVIDVARDEEGSSNDFVVAHRCSMAKCFNPRHMTIVTQQVNESHKGCRFGCRQLCPHKPKCIFVNQGRYIPCLNKRSLPSVCKHSRLCHPSLKPRRTATEQEYSSETCKE